MPTILYAEDDPQVAELVQFFFQRDAPEIAVEVATTGGDCLARMSGGGYDLLLLDLVLPGRDGLAILSDLARRGDPTPVIVLSSHGQFEQTVSVLRAGAVDCIDKKTGRFLQIARTVRGFLGRGERGPDGSFAAAAAEAPELRTVVLLEKNDQIALELSAILGLECPRLRIRPIASRTDWDRLIATESPLDALVLTDEWPLADVTDAMRDFRSASRGGPAILISRKHKLDVVIAAYALGCRDCVVQKHGYQFELARSLNHLLRASAAICKR